MSKNEVLAFLGYDIYLVMAEDHFALYRIMFTCRIRNFVWHQIEK